MSTSLCSRPSRPAAVSPRPFNAHHGKPSRGCAPGWILLLLATGLAGCQEEPEPEAATQDSEEVTPTPDAAAADRDGDGTSDDADCDPIDASVYPGSLEWCDGIDNDCDGVLEDESDARRWFLDADADGFGTGDVIEGYCVPTGTAASAARGDCDDADAAVHPGAADMPDDGVDSDCGGTDSPEPHVGLSDSSLESIHDALYAATSGDTVWVGPGTYPEADISFLGKAIALRSTHLAEKTIVEPDYTGRGFIFSGGETEASVLDGVTVHRAGDYDMPGGAVFIEDSSPTLMGSVFSSSHALQGGGAYLTGSSARIEACHFESNLCRKLDRMCGRRTLCGQLHNHPSRRRFPGQPPHELLRGRWRPCNVGHHRGSLRVRLLRE